MYRVNKKKGKGMGKSISKRVISIIVIVLMSVQIVMGLVWAVMNITSVPMFSDTSEYVALSESFRLDEYRTILYPLFLKYIMQAAGKVNIAYNILVYIIQTVVSLLSIFYVVTAFTKLVRKKLSILKRLFVTLYLFTIPFVLWMNFSVLPDAFALCAVLILGIKMTQLVFTEKNPVLLWLAAGISYAAAALLTPAYTWIGLIFIIVVLLGRLFFTRGEKKGLRKFLYRFLIPLFVTGCVLLGIRLVDVNTQTSRINGKVPPSISYSLFERVAWPDLSVNYDDFSDEVKQYLTKEETRSADMYYQNLTNQLAPNLESVASFENTPKLFRDMAMTVLKNNPGRVLTKIGKSILKYFLIPQSSLAHKFGVFDLWNDFNMTAVAGTNEMVTNIYYLYFLITFGVLFCLSTVILLLVRKKDRQKRKYYRVLFTLWIIVTLWYSLTTGAPTDERYVLPVYVIWGLLGVLTLFPKVLNVKRRIISEEQE